MQKIIFCYWKQRKIPKVPSSDIQLVPKGDKQATYGKAPSGTEGKRPVVSCRQSSEIQKGSELGTWGIFLYFQL